MLAPSNQSTVTRKKIKDLTKKISLKTKLINMFLT